MASTYDEIEQLLDAEVFIDIEKLRELGRHGLPSKLRGEAWKYLSGLYPCDKSEEMSVSKDIQERYGALDKEGRSDEFIKRVRGEIKRFFPPDAQFADQRLRAKFERVVIAYCNMIEDTSVAHGLVRDPAIVRLAGPIVVAVSSESDAFGIFEIFVSRLGNNLSSEGLRSNISEFMMLMRQLMPTLYDHLEDEEVGFEWISNWLRYLLSRELRLPLVMRLWDVYFTEERVFSLHPFACLAILMHCTDRLIEIEESELRGVLQHLPTVPMDVIIHQAYYLKEDDSVRKLI